MSWEIVLTADKNIETQDFDSVMASLTDAQKGSININSFGKNVKLSGAYKDSRNANALAEILKDRLSIKGYLVLVGSFSNSGINDRDTWAEAPKKKLILL